jgi:hypothetical protein
MHHAFIEIPAATPVLYQVERIRGKVPISEFNAVEKME